MSNEASDMDDDMLVKYLTGEASRNEDIFVTNWIAESEANKREYERFKIIWEQSKHVAATSTVDKDAAYLRLQNRIKNTPAARRINIRKMKPAYWVGAAASLLLISTITWLAVSNYYNQTIAFVKIESNNRVRTQTLPDGSLITLNKKSTLIYPERFTGNIRPVSLLGEAFFKISPNKRKPFIIKVNDVTVRVVGTSFNIKSRNGKTEVNVETGIVNVSKKQNNINLNPGEQVTVIKNQDLVKETSKGKLYNFYVTHQLVCDQTPLIELVYAVNEAYNAHINIADKTLGQQPITTVFDNQSLSQVLDVITETFKVKAIQKGNKIILK